MKQLKDFPEIDFIDGITLEQVRDEMLKDFQEEYHRLTGENIRIGKADPARMILYACALQIYQGMEWVNRAGKQSFLKYAYGDYLENLGALKGITRNQGTRARTTIRITLARPQIQAMIIPRGSRVTPGNGVYFYFPENVEIPAGEEVAEAVAACIDKGSSGNGFYPGDINVLADPVPFVEAVKNIDISSGGSDVEDDESLAERIYLAPSRYSVAGPGDAYAYHVKTFNSDVGDVRVTSPAPGEVDICFVLKEGLIPDELLLKELQDYLEREDIRPMTDKVTVRAPKLEPYEIEFDYFINASDSGMAGAIQEKVNLAVLDYISWQEERIGRDINPDALVSRIVAAGAKRAAVKKPLYRVISDQSIAKHQSRDIRYGGTEDD